MRLLHVADLHVGMLMGGISLVRDHEHVLRQIVDLVSRERADALLVPGDLYDKSLPSATAVEIVSSFLTAAAQTGARVFVTCGNHDAPERIGYLAPLLARQGVFVAGPYEGTVPHHTVVDAWGPVTFWLIPFIKPSMVRRYFPDEQIETYTDALRCVISHCDIDRSQRNVALSHQFVTSSGFNPMRDYLLQHPEMASRVQVGGLNNVDVSVYDPFDYVALGHIHRRQRVGRDGVWYAGSPLKFSTSDEEMRDQKTATLVELGPAPAAGAGDFQGAEAAVRTPVGEGGTSSPEAASEPSPEAAAARGWAHVDVRAIPLTPLHDVRPLRGELADLVDPKVVAQNDAVDDYLRVTLTDENPPVDALAQLHAVYPNIVQYLVDNARAHARGATGASDADVERRDPLELFQRFFEEQNGAPMDDAQTRLVAEELEKVEAR